MGSQPILISCSATWYGTDSKYLLLPRQDIKSAAGGIEDSIALALPTRVHVDRLCTKPVQEGKSRCAVPRHRLLLLSASQVVCDELFYISRGRSTLFPVGESIPPSS